MGDDEPQGDFGAVAPPRTLYNNEGAIVRIEYPMKTKHYTGPKDEERLNFVEFYERRPGSPKTKVLVVYYERDGSIRFMDRYDGPAGNEIPVRRERP